MRIPRFELERWQSKWEHRVAINVAESGVLPMTIAELLEDPEQVASLVREPLLYPPTNGSEALRRNIAALYPGADESNVLVTCGCSEANFLVAWSLVEAGDVVAPMRPNYLQIEGVVRGLGARVFPLQLNEEAGWGLDRGRVDDAIDPATRLIAVCNPNNPTGTVLSEAAIDGICTAAERNGAWILADEVYRGAEFEGDPSPTFWGRGQRIVCTGGLSKAFGLPGLRVGWIVGPAELVERLWAYHDYTTICAAGPSQSLARLALEPEPLRRVLARTRRILRERYPIVDAWVQGHGDALVHRPPSAGAIAWIGLRNGVSSQRLVERLLREHDVLAVPGEQFGVPSYLRIGFGGDEAELREALRHLDSALAAEADGETLV